MARPGQKKTAAQIAGGVDLSKSKMTDEQARDAQEQMELRSGMRCGGCGRRITMGYQFTSLAPRAVEAPVIRLSACAREDCDYAMVLRDGATVMEMVEYAWLDELGNDAPPAKAVVEAQARSAQAKPHGKRASRAEVASA
jgi:predicted metal-binding protein